MASSRDQAGATRWQADSLVRTITGPRPASLADQSIEAARTEAVGEFGSFTDNGQLVYDAVEILSEEATGTGPRPRAERGARIHSGLPHRLVPCERSHPTPKRPDSGLRQPGRLRWGMAAGVPLFIAGSARYGAHAGQPLGLLVDPCEEN